MNKIESSIGAVVQGFYKVAIVDANGVEIWKQPEWNKNLILNRGLDEMADRYYADLCSAVSAGTGSRVNKFVGGDSTISAIGGKVYLWPGATGLQDFSSSIVGDWSGSLHSGDIIKFANGQEVMVTGSRTSHVIPHDFTASIQTATAISTQSFTIWKTSQVGLHKPVTSGGTYVFGAGYNGTNITESMGKVTFYRTRDTPTVSGSISYTEMGVGWGSNNLFSRIVLPSPVTLAHNQRMRVYYALQVQFTPTGSVFTPNVPISGWPVSPSTDTNATQSLQNISYGNTGTIAYISSDGNRYVGGSSLEIVDPSYIWASVDSRSLVVLGTPPIDREQYSQLSYRQQSVVLPYIPGTYERIKYLTIGSNYMNSNSIRSFGFGSVDYYANHEATAFAMVFDQPQTKTNMQTLTISFRWSWGRVIQ